MKARTSFVANSSSSSFVLAIPTAEFTAKELEEWIFRGERIYINPYRYGNSPAHWDSNVIIDILINGDSMCNGLLQISMEEIHETVLTGWYDGKPEYPDSKYPNEDWRKSWDEWEELNIKRAKEFAERFVSNNKGCSFFGVEIEDHSDVGAAMEHGDLFRNVPHIRASNH